MFLTPFCTEVRNRGQVMVSGDVYEQDGGFSRSPEAQEGYKHAEQPGRNGYS